MIRKFSARREKVTGIAQLHPMGCSVACVAFRCGVSYRRALSLFAQPELAWKRGYYCREIVEALARADLTYEYAKYDAIAHAGLLKKEGTIIFIGQCEKYPLGHYMIRERRGWMNSWSNYPLMMPVEAAFQRQPVAKVEYIIYEPE